MAIDVEKYARVYRFGDNVALHLDGAPNTLYLTPKLAKSLSRTLKNFAKDCEGVKFTDSTLGSIDLAD